MAGGNLNPYAPQSGFASPPAKKSNLWLWILLGVGGGAAALVICCGGGTYWAISASSRMVGDALRQEVRGNPIVEERLGEIASLEANLVESGEETQKRGGSNNWVVMDAKGSKGNGKFIIQSSPSPQPGNMFTSIELRMPSGETFTIK